MNVFDELERITNMRDLGDSVVIETTDNRTHTAHTVPKTGLKFCILEEMQTFCFQNTGANTIWYSTWSQISDQLEAKGINIPEEIKPCRTCDGTRCRFWCTKH
ncbi:MAG: hypothetical protein NTX82_04495 [Candidatus Parcubacteria bacterium]|nr:hypothetical protein [Candidatus Parcubacteria bacterium]